MRIFFSGLALALCTSLPAAEKDWSEHAGKLDFVIGWDKGLAESKFSGKPMMAFFTTTW